MKIRNKALYRRYHASLCLAVAGTWLIGLSAQARQPFPTTVGGSYTSYTANVAYRVNKVGQRMTTVSGTNQNCSVQGGIPSNTVDYTRNAWQLMGMADSNSTATVRVTLDQPYSLNKIVTQYSDSLGVPPGEYELRLSTDAVSWTTNVARKPISTATHTDTFTMISARYIEWQVWGPGVDIAGTKYTYMMELQAYTSSSGAVVPYLDDGFNYFLTGSLASKSGWTSWAQPEATLDGNLFTYAIPSPAGTAVVDTASSVLLHQLQFAPYPGQTWTWCKVEISPDQASWTTVVDAVTWPGGTYTFDPVSTRYLRISGEGGGALCEIEGFAIAPAKGTVILVQ